MIGTLLTSYGLPYGLPHGLPLMTRYVPEMGTSSHSRDILSRLFASVDVV
jgi:hypothetical protein